MTQGLINIFEVIALYYPNNRSEDFAVNETLFNWQSQSKTSENSPTGKRYISYDSEGSKVLLLLREYKEVNNRAQPYICPGTAGYVSHTKSRPMNIRWRMDEEMPARILKSAKKMIVG